MTRPEAEERRPRHRNGAHITNNSLPRIPDTRVRFNGQSVSSGTDLRALVAALVAADPGPQVTLAMARRWAADARADGYEAGWDAGRLDLIADEKRAQVRLVRVLREFAPPRDRWRVLCGPCRRGGPNRYRPKCPQCEWRTRATFSTPHPDDWAGQGGEAA